MVNFIGGCGWRLTKRSVHFFYQSLIKIVILKTNWNLLENTDKEAEE